MVWINKLPYHKMLFLDPENLKNNIKSFNDHYSATIWDNDWSKLNEIHPSIIMDNFEFTSIGFYFTIYIQINHSFRFRLIPLKYNLSTTYNSLFMNEISSTIWAISHTVSNQIIQSYVINDKSKFIHKFYEWNIRLCT